MKLDNNGLMLGRLPQSERANVEKDRYKQAETTKNGIAGLAGDADATARPKGSQRLAGHQSRGQIFTGRCTPQGGELAVEMCVRRYAGFRQLPASEHLAKDNVMAESPQILCRMLMATEQWTARKRRGRHHMPRASGQIAGSERDWLEERGL